MPNPFYTYIKYVISKHILKITFFNKADLVSSKSGVHIVKWFHLISNNSVNHNSLLFTHCSSLV